MTFMANYFKSPCRGIYGNFLAQLSRTYQREHIMKFMCLSYSLIIGLHFLL